MNTEQVLFTTPRLHFRSLLPEDADSYFDMMGNPAVMSIIPREIMTRKESDTHLNQYLDPSKRVWAVVLKGTNVFIGIAGIIDKEETGAQIGYRLREKYWRQGFGTEIAKGLVAYGFEHLQLEKISANVAPHNTGSIRILDKIMSPVYQFFNEEDQCNDWRYEIKKIDWKQ